jgi:hypothetical protein
VWYKKSGWRRSKSRALFLLLLLTLYHSLSLKGITFKFTFSLFWCALPPPPPSRSIFYSLLTAAKHFSIKSVAICQKPLTPEDMMPAFFIRYFFPLIFFFKGNPLLFFLYMSFDSAITFKG